MSRGNLRTSQAGALAHVARLSSGPPLNRDLRVTLNFHPDRVSRGTPILRSLADSGVYVSQFVTGTGNGGLTAHPGGDRWRWESRLFGGAYDHAPASERPVYGALDHRRGPVGAAPRFGSSHFRLTAATLERTTFCYPDSCLDPSDFGIAAHLALVELALADRRDALDDCVEAHVHGPVRLDRDVEALVLDPCYRGTDRRRGRRPSAALPRGMAPRLPADRRGAAQAPRLPGPGHCRAGHGDRRGRGARPTPGGRGGRDGTVRPSGGQEGVALPGALRGAGDVPTVPSMISGRSLRMSRIEGISAWYEPATQEKTKPPSRAARCGRPASTR